MPFGQLRLEYLPASGRHVHFPRTPMSKHPSPFSVEALFESLGRYLLAQFKKLYFKAVESAGHHKRDILVTRVEHARDSLEEAKTQFQTALERFGQLTRFEGGDLEIVYRQLKSEYDYSHSKALAVRDRIDAVEDVALALFNEWEGELNQYTNRSLRSSSRQKLKQTQQHYGHLITAMRRAEHKIDPVLGVFHDQVLYLKHNLNANAIASLDHELRAMTVGVSGLIDAMERSINRANDFVGTLNATQPKALPANRT